MIVTIHPDPVTRTTIWIGAAAISSVILLYAVIWLKFVKKLPLFKAVPLEKELEIIRQRAETPGDGLQERPSEAGAKRERP
jgi:hypothetical protein